MARTEVFPKSWIINFDAITKIGRRLVRRSKQFVIYSSAAELNSSGFFMFFYSRLRNFTLPDLCLISLFII